MNDYQAVIDNLQNTLELPSIKMVPQIKRKSKKEMMKLGFDGALNVRKVVHVYLVLLEIKEIMNKGYEFFRKRYFFVKKIEKIFKTSKEKSVIKNVTGRNLLTGEDINGTLSLAAYDVAVIGKQS